MWRLGSQTVVNGVRATKRHEGSSADFDVELGVEFNGEDKRSLFIHRFNCDFEHSLFLDYTHDYNVLAHADTDHLCCVSVSAVEGIAVCALVENDNHMGRIALE